MERFIVTSSLPVELTVTIFKIQYGEIYSFTSVQVTSKFSIFKIQYGEIYRLLH